MVIQHNLSAINANGQLNKTTYAFAKSTEKLSSGYRINRAADDAAGLAISEKMRRQIRGLTQASENAADGVAFVQIADGALNEVHDMLHRAQELAVRAANGTLSDTDRAYLNEELTQLKSEINRVSETSTFNEINVFTVDGHKPAEAEYEKAEYEKAEYEKAEYEKAEYNIVWSMIGSDGKVANVAESQAVGSANSYGNSSLAQFTKRAAADAISDLTAAYPTLFSTASSKTINIGLDLSDIDGSSGTLAQAGLTMSGNGTSTMMSYTLKVDTSDYSIAGFDSMTDEAKADLAAVIAHEMTHAISYDTITGNITAGTAPLWFIEGFAQASSGDNGWVSNRLNPASSDEAVKGYMSQLTSMPYGAGYLGVMYLGQSVNDKATGTAGAVNSANIKKGLDRLLTEMAKGKSLNNAISDLTDYSGLNDFQSKFAGADAPSFLFVRDLLDARGTKGAGSLLAPSLATDEKTAFAPGALNGNTGNYVINTDNTKYANAFGTGYTFPEQGDGGGTGGTGGGGTGGNADGGDDIILQIGSEQGQTLKVMRFNASYEALAEGAELDVSTIEKAQATLDAVKIANKNVSQIRSYYGAVQNRLEHTIANLDNTVENTTSAESAIRDTDMAREMLIYSNQNILEQAGQAMLAQANQNPQRVLELLQQ